MVTVVTITGVSLTQISAVTFDGVNTSFKVESDTEVTADVPSGTKTGKIAITTAGRACHKLGDVYGQAVKLLYSCGN